MWEEGGKSTLRGLWKNLTPNLTNLRDFKGLKISVEEVTADMAETARELESVEPKDVTELLPSR